MLPHTIMGGTISPPSFSQRSMARFSRPSASIIDLLGISTRDVAASFFIKSFVPFHMMIILEAPPRT